MASLALSMMMMPTITRTVEVVLRLVPDGLREAGLALGASRARMVWSVVLPTARTGLTTAVVLGIARAVGETAPLLFTAFGYDLHERQPVQRSAGEPPALRLQATSRSRRSRRSSAGFAGALVLMLLVLTPLRHRPHHRPRPRAPGPSRPPAPAPSRKAPPRHERHHGQTRPLVGRRPSDRADRPDRRTRARRSDATAAPCVGGPPPGCASLETRRRLRLVRRSPRARGRRPRHGRPARSPRSSARRAAASRPSCACSTGCTSSCPARRSTARSSSTATTSTSRACGPSRCACASGMVFQKPNPFPAMIDPRQRARRASSWPGSSATTRTRWSSSRSSAPASGARCATG